MCLEHLHRLRRHGRATDFHAQRAHHLCFLGVDEQRHAPLTTRAAEGSGHGTIFIQATVLVKLHRFVTLSADKFHDTGLLAGSACTVSKNVRTRSPICNSACPAGEAPYSSTYGVP